MAATEESEKNLSLSLIKFADIIDGAYKDNAPHKICQFIYEVSTHLMAFIITIRYFQNLTRLRRQVILHLSALLRAFSSSVLIYLRLNALTECKGEI